MYGDSGKHENAKDGCHRGGTYEKHPKYGKTVQYTKKYKIHDPLEECSVGDRVLAHETRHFSKTKYFRFYRKLY